MLEGLRNASPDLGIAGVAEFVPFVQQIESHLISPLVVRHVLALPPALTVFSVVGLGVVLGPLGLIFAAPLTVLLVVVVGKLYVRETLGAPLKVPGEQQTPVDPDVRRPVEGKC